MPANRATLPTEIAMVRSLAGKYRAATLVIELSTNGWPAAITNWPGEGPAVRRRAGQAQQPAGAGQDRAQA